jgi:Peptidase family M23
MRRLVLTSATLLTFLSLPQAARAEWIWPLRGDVITPYRNGDDPYASGQHRGIDIAGDTGAPVVAATGGEVRFAGTAGSSGLTVSVRTADGRFDTSYLHLSSVAVREGERIAAGDSIGAVGTTGVRSAAAPHLHFGVRDAGSRHAYHDPLRFLPPPTAPQPPREAPAPQPAPVPVAPAPAPLPAPAGRRVPIRAPAQRRVPPPAPSPRRVPSPAPSPRRVPEGAPRRVPPGALRRVPEAAPRRVPTRAPRPVPTGAPRPVPTGAPRHVPTGAPRHAPMTAPADRRVPGTAPANRRVPVGAPSPDRVPLGVPSPQSVPAEAAAGSPVPMEAQAGHPAAVDAPRGAPANASASRRPPIASGNAARHGQGSPGSGADHATNPGERAATAARGPLGSGPDLGLLLACLGLVVAAALLGLTGDGRKATRRTGHRIGRALQPLLGRR